VAEKGKVDDEIAAGIRDAQGMKFGLTVMKKGEGGREGGREGGKEGGRERRGMFPLPY